MKCLVVDDQPINTQVLSAQLKHIGAEVDVCFSGLDAISLSQFHQFDVIFMDINMPGIDGIEAAKIITNNDSNNCIIAVSGDDEPVTLANCFKAWLVKPVRKSQLVMILQDFVEL